MPRPYRRLLVEEGEMASIKEVLSKVREGKTVEAISEELDVRESTLRAMIDFMVGKGYLEEFEGGDGCAACPLNRKCSLPAPGERRLKMYALTREGMEHITE